MSKLGAGLVGVFLFAVLVLAASPLGSVSCAGAIEISGIKLSASSVSSWPVVAGDVIVTHKFPAVMFLRDQSRVTLEPNSRVLIEVSGNHTGIRLLDGNLLYSAASSPGLSFLVRGSQITPVAGTKAALSASLAVSPIAGAMDYGTRKMTAAAVPNPSNVNPF